MEIIKITAEINKVENRKTIDNIDKLTLWKENKLMNVARQTIKLKGLK